MSIPLRDGFSDEPLERCLEDLLVRFVVNCPEEDLSSMERLLFQIEEAHWFYQDFIRTLNPLLPSMKMKQFTNLLIKQAPLIWKWGDPNEALAEFGKYKATIPVRGCALLNKSMDKVLLVKGIESSSWGFPRGKISKDETDIQCALRELEEETGFDATDLIDEDEFVERTIRGKNYKIYIVKDVPDNTVFEPKVRFEIVDIKWMSIKQLTKSIKQSNNFYLVNLMLKPIISFIKRVKNIESEEELKRLATIQLKKYLGMDKDSVINENEESVDPGRALLSMLQNGAKNAKQNGAVEPDSNQNASQVHLAQPNIPLPPMLNPQQLQYAMQYPQSFGGLPIPNQHPGFPLHMFNPYAAFPLLNQPHGGIGMPNPMLPFMTHHIQQQHAVSQDMALAPSASTFSKPQFSMQRRHDPANSKALLSVLKAKPSQKQDVKSNSSDLLNILKRDISISTKSSAPASPRVTNSSSTFPSSPVMNQPVRILKREKSNQESRSISASPNLNNSKLRSIKREEDFDITKPANESTSRDISASSLNSAKPIVLLRKPSANSNVELRQMKFDDSKPELPQKSAETDHSNNSSAIKKHNIKSLPISIETLGSLTHPNTNNNNDPSAQLLGLLKKKTPISAPPALSQDQEEVNIGITAPSIQSNSAVTSDPSKNLLELLKKREDVTTNPSNDLLNLLIKPQESNTMPTSEPSKNLLNLLKNPSGLTSRSNSDDKSFNDNSSHLLNVLKKQDTTANTTANVQPSNTSSSDDSTKLLSLLKRDTTVTPPPTSTQFTSSVTPSNDASASLLNILKKPTSNAPGTQPAVQSSVSDSILKILKAPTFTERDVQTEQQVEEDSEKSEDFEDFEDFEDAEEYDNGLYD